MWHSWLLVGSAVKGERVLGEVHRHLTHPSPDADTCKFQFTCLRGLIITAHTYFHGTHSSANVAGTRRPYMAFGGTRLRINGIEIAIIIRLAPLATAISKM